MAQLRRLAIRLDFAVTAVRSAEICTYLVEQRGRGIRSYVETFYVLLQERGQHGHLSRDLAVG